MATVTRPTERTQAIFSQIESESIRLVATSVPRAEKMKPGAAQTKFAHHVSQIEARWLNAITAAIVPVLTT